VLDLKPGRSLAFWRKKRLAKTSFAAMQLCSLRSFCGVQLQHKIYQRQPSNYTTKRGETMKLLKNREGGSILGYMTSSGYIIIAILVYFLAKPGLVWAIFWPVWLVVLLFNKIFG
jgi:hypothetical protein